MGNFSRDTYRQTNVLSQLIGGTSVTDPRAYVGVRVQQGVPLLDADLNELEDIRRGEHEALGSFWIGTGAPVGSDGFRISKSATPNDFTINAGTFLVDGWFLYLAAPVTYLTQPRAAGQPQTPPLPTLPALPALTPPGTGDGTRYDLVYLDAWEREVSPDDDWRLQDPNLGMPTALRLQREWVVRLEPEVSATDPGIPPAVRTLYPGHRLTPLALVRRKETVAAIVPDDITDLRRTDLTLAAGESPLRVYAADGSLAYDWGDFAAVHEQAIAMYGAVLGSDLFLNVNFNDINAAQAVVVLDAFGDVKGQCRTAAMLSAARLVGVRGALELLTRLADVQKALYDRLKPIADAATRRVTTSQFLDQLLVFIGDQAGQTYRGLRQALSDGGPREAIEAQMAINNFVGTRTGTAPTGRVIIEHTDSPPVDEQITAPGTYRYVYKVTSNVSMEETFDIDAHVENAPDWVVTVPTTIQLATNQFATVNADVTIPAVTASPGGRLVLRVRSERNPGAIDFADNDAEVLLNQAPAPVVPLTITLISPAVNIALDQIAVGRGTPFGLSGKGVNAQFKALSSGTAMTDEQYTATFTFSVPDKFEPISDAHMAMAGNGDFATFPAVLQATIASTNGDEVDMTVTVAKDSDAAVTKSIVVMLKVQK